MIFKRLLLLTFFLSTFLVAISRGASAQSFLRDAEMEAFLREISNPIFEAAGLTPQSVRIYILADNSVNAFVTGGQNIFIHTGLINSSDNVDQLLGVIAHETCHIACGHRIRTGNAIAKAGTISILSTILGAAAIALGGGDAGLGLLLAGQQTARGQFLAYSRGQEGEADIAGAGYLDSIGSSGHGMIEFFDKLRDQEILAQIRQDPYVRTHPIGRQRILNLQQIVEESVYYKREISPDITNRFKRLKAKLAGYLDSPRTTLANYPLSDQSISARYARVYAYHKALEWDLALDEANGLIELEPNNPYFYEIKGQVLFENHKLEESVEVFAEALRHAPNHPLLLTAYGQALVSQEDPAKMQQAVVILKHAARLDPSNTFAWFNLARAYSGLGEEALANLATAERYYGVGVSPQAYRHALRAVEKFETGTPDWIRAQDIIVATEHAAQDGGRRRRR